MTFRGSFRFSDQDELAAALAQVQELVDGEDDVATALVLQRRGCELRVVVETICARDEYLGYETLIEALATFACGGEVIGEIDDTLTTYAAVVAQSAIPKVAMMALPLLANAFGDLSMVIA